MKEHIKKVENILKVLDKAKLKNISIQEMLDLNKIVQEFGRGIAELRKIADNLEKEAKIKEEKSEECQD